MKEKLISISISNQVLQYNNDIQKRKSYAVNLETNNFKNILYHIINNAKISDFCIFNSYLYTNTDNI